MPGAIGTMGIAAIDAIGVGSMAATGDWVATIFEIESMLIVLGNT